MSFNALDKAAVVILTTPALTALSSYIQTAMGPSESQSRYSAAGSVAFAKYS